MNWGVDWSNKPVDWVAPQQPISWGIDKAGPNGDKSSVVVIDNGNVRNPIQSDWDALDQDALLVLWQQKKDAIETAKSDEMELRKYIVNRAFPQKHEGTNTLELGGGYELKANVKFNYKLANNDVVEATLNEIEKVSNEGAFIADRLVSWTPNFLLTEFRSLQDEAEKGSQQAKDILKLVEKMLTITDAAPTLNIKEPKKKK